MSAQWGQAGQFLRSIEPTDACIPWPFAMNPQGYGVTWLDGRTVLAHRASYLFHVGPLGGPDAYLDHLCHTRDDACPGGDTCPHRACINPLHLEPVDAVENVRRGRGLGNGGRFHAAKTECPQGHPYSGDNVRIRPNGHRACRACERSRSTRTRQARKESS